MSQQSTISQMQELQIEKEKVLDHIQGVEILQDHLIVLGHVEKMQFYS